MGYSIQRAALAPIRRVSWRATSVNVASPHRSVLLVSLVLASRAHCELVAVVLQLSRLGLLPRLAVSVCAPFLRRISSNETSTDLPLFRLATDFSSASSV